MTLYRLNSELFTIPWQNGYIIYSPFFHLALSTTRGVVQLLKELPEMSPDRLLTEDEKKIISLLERLKLINGPRLKIPAEKNDPFCPIHATLFLTTRCNLRCKYCYASGGEKQVAVLPSETARAAIDLVTSNALQKNKRFFGIGFHGGGEPTLAWEALEYSVNYAKRRAAEHNLKVRFGMATNGLISSPKLDWIMDNFAGINLSFDGPPEIHNEQRPMANGGNSFSKVMQTILKMNERGYHYVVRATITDKSVRFMDKICAFVGRHCKTSFLHFEPTFSCGRCASTGTNSPSADAFIAGFRKACKVARQFNLQTYYSGARLGIFTTSFCKATGESFCITPDGEVTACYEVCSREDPRAEVFFFGKYDTLNGRFEFYEEKLVNLRRRNINNIEYCKDCFCKYHCAGDCMAKATVGNNITSIADTSRCKINQALTLDKLVDIMKTDTAIDLLR